ncbi:hypothetical protein BpHYR1_024181 [Brachionus plicatilis]|uniref:Uncharacterized protein n=1 Tax=Brachionus plicatilis TaxID=10195 RepID=A0A3M7SKP9_BRAPC|nr:hypothetical protein BpHYR1_024181 [Brachionus plicatilis]
MNFMLEFDFGIKFGEEKKTNFKNRYFDNYLLEKHASAPQNKRPLSTFLPLSTSSNRSRSLDEQTDSDGYFIHVLAVVEKLTKRGRKANDAKALLVFFYIKLGQSSQMT